jgi:hypothetical protein
MRVVQQVAAHGLRRSYRTESASGIRLHLLHWPDTSGERWKSARANSTFRLTTHTQICLPTIEKDAFNVANIDTRLAASTSYNIFSKFLPPPSVNLEIPGHQLPRIIVLSLAYQTYLPQHFHLDFQRFYNLFLCSV